MDLHCKYGERASELERVSEKNPNKWNRIHHWRLSPTTTTFFLSLSLDPNKWAIYLCLQTCVCISWTKQIPISYLALYQLESSKRACDDENEQIGITFSFTVSVHHFQFKWIDGVCSNGIKIVFIYGVYFIHFMHTFSHWDGNQPIYTILRKKSIEWMHLSRILLSWLFSDISI